MDDKKNKKLDEEQNFILNTAIEQVLTGVEDEVYIQYNPRKYKFMLLQNYKELKKKIKNLIYGENNE